MAVSLMGNFFEDGAQAGGWDEVDEVKTDPNQRNNSITKPIAGEDDANQNITRNPFDNFTDTEDPDSYLETYEKLKEDISKIEKNTKKIHELGEKIHHATSTDANTSIMTELDRIMTQNSSITLSVKSKLKSEKKENDKYEKNHQFSSVNQWRVNQLNSCTRRFKTASLEFSQALNAFNITLRQKQGRLINIVDDEQKLNDQQKEAMVNDFDAAQRFIQDQFQMMDTSDAMIDRLAELEARHEGMIKIEKSIKELQQLWNELNVLVTEQQELLDNISSNVEMTKDYVVAATGHLKKAEDHQKKSRKYQLIACCCCLALLVIIIIILGGTGTFSGS